MVWLPDGEINLRICLAVYTEQWHVTDKQMDRQIDRQMDRQTSCHSILRTMHMRRAVKMHSTGTSQTL